MKTYGCMQEIVFQKLPEDVLGSVFVILVGAHLETH